MWLRKGEMMAKRHISITNDRVLEAFDNAVIDNKGSRLIEEAILFYLDFKEEGYATTGYVDEVATEWKREVNICNQNYLQLKLVLDDLVKEVFKK